MAHAIKMLDYVFATAPGQWRRRFVSRVTCVIIAVPFVAVAFALVLNLATKME
ncbi:MAG: hypothetical protein ABUS48_01265 [Pseudomonadota bacterium]